MEKKFKLGIIGGGYMAYSIVSGAINGGALNCSDIFVCDLSQESLNKFNKLNVETTLDSKELADLSEFVLFAIKPQNSTQVFENIKDCSCNKFISIMAGIKKQTIKNYFGDCLVARCMPNAPCSVGNGAVGIDLSDFSDENDKKFIFSVFSSISTVVELSEDKMNAVTGISGSSPAYFYLFAKILIESGVKHGLTQEQAFDLVVNTMIGSGKLLLNNKDKNIDELIDSVCSKGGTTIQAIKLFKEHGFEEITKNAVDACVNRAFELENL